MAHPEGLGGPQRVTRRDSHTGKVQTYLNDSRFTCRFYHCDSTFFYTIKLRTACSSELLPDTPFPAKISKRPSLKLSSVVGAYSFYGARYTSKTLVCEVLSEVSGNLIFAAHDIDSIEPSEVIPNHEHLLLPSIDCTLYSPQTPRKAWPPSLAARVSVVLEMGFARLLAMEHPWVPVRFTFRCFAVSRRSPRAHEHDRTNSESR